jgi:hypothetical protein
MTPRRPETGLSPEAYARCDPSTPSGALGPLNTHAATLPKARPARPRGRREERLLNMPSPEARRFSRHAGTDVTTLEDVTPAQLRERTEHPAQGSLSLAQELRKLVAMACTG